jgi:hypothetical protein
LTTSKLRGRCPALQLINSEYATDKDRSSTAHTTPFTFDFLAQSFPALVLHILPHQPTILSSQLIPSAKCWPIDPPTKTHFDLLRKLLASRLDEFAAEQRAARNQRDSEDSVPSVSSNDTVVLSFDSSSYFEHLGNAYNAWAGLQDLEKHKQYHLEFARAYAREQLAHAETKAQLEHAKHVNAHQGIQIKRLNELQQPQEFLRSPALAAPYTTEIGKFVATQLGSDQLPEAEALISKWRPSVKNNPGFQRGLMPHIFDSPNVDGDGGTNNTLTETPQMDHSASNGFGSHAANGTDHNCNSMPTLDHEAGDSEDASGEDDDEVEVMPPAVNAKHVGLHGLRPIDSMIDPSLGARDTGDFGAATLMANLEYRKSSRR